MAIWFIKIFMDYISLLYNSNVIIFYQIYWNPFYSRIKKNSNIWAKIKIKIDMRNYFLETKM